MTAKYVLHRWLLFHAKKGIRQWHLYADEDQIVKITDELGKYEVIRPVDLFGDFDIEISIVDDFERDMLTQQNFSFAAQNVLPLFMDVVNKRELAKVAFDKILKIDVSPMLLPDISEQSRMRAKAENQSFMEGQYIPPSLDEDFDMMLREHEGLEIELRGADSDPRYASAMALVTRHIEETRYLQRQKQPTGGQANLAAAPGNETPGEAVGNTLLAGPAGAAAAGG
jgi:hypothetical protein